MDDAAVSGSSASDPTLAFYTDTEHIRISVVEAAYLIHHFHIKGTSCQQHQALRDLVNGMCVTSVGRSGLQHLLEKAHLDKYHAK